MKNANDVIKIVERHAVEKGSIKPDRMIFVVKPESVRKLFEELVERVGYEWFYLSTVVGADMKEENRFRLDYYVVVLPEERTIVIRTYIPRDQPVIDSIVDIVPAAFSAENETYDLLGIVFKGNPALRRGFFVSSDVVDKGVYPLRKDAIGVWKWQLQK
ncbi:MAG: NADH-quinone oxidoreductase subunit C [Ignisphaera sp.]